MESQKSLLSEDLEIDDQVKLHLLDTSKWAKFIAIFMFIVCGIVFLALLSGSSKFVSGLSRNLGEYGDMTANEALAFLAIFLVAVIAVTIAYYFLYNFSSKTKVAVQAEQPEALHAGLRSLKNYFIIWSILGGLIALFTLLAIGKLL